MNIAGKPGKRFLPGPFGVETRGVEWQCARAGWVGIPMGARLETV